MLHFESMQKLSNIHFRGNYGFLSATTPFQLFGPLPTVGSFLDFESSELLNKDISQIIFQITWLDLPLNFSSYYEGYDTGINNGSFKVNFSQYCNGNSELLHGCPFSLFEEYKNEGKLLLTSTFYLKVNKKLLFTEKTSNNNYPMEEWKCYFRMELIEPDDAFGHIIYPRALTKVMIHNEKRWSKKRNIPSTPYTPVVSKIGISMTY